MPDRLHPALALLPGYLAAHVTLSLAAMALAIVAGLPLAVAAARNRRVRGPVLVAVGLIQTIPGLALLALFYPLLLALGTLLHVPLPALGFLPSLLALALYALLPIVRNGVAGLTGVDPTISEAADGVGMTRGQKLFRVEAPLAAPVVMAGIRTATVWTIGAATLATTVGQVSLGNFIFAGLQTEDWVLVLVGCAAAAGLAIVADLLLGLIESGLARRERWRVIAGAALLLAGGAAALAPSFAASGRPVVIGAKNFSEQYILAALFADRIERAGGTAEIKSGLGSAVAYRALAGGDVDAYVDYAGTLWTNVLGRRDTPPAPVMIAALTRELRARDGVRVLGPLGFENAYALAMRADRASALGVRNIADLARVAPKLTLGSDLEFLSRPEWAALRAAYGLNFRTARAYSPTFMYRALQSGDADVISAFSSDGRIAADRLVVLADPKGAIPRYDALILLGAKAARNQMLVRALTPLISAIPVSRMRAANYLVDRDSDKRSPEQAARWLLPAASERTR